MKNKDKITIDFLAKAISGKIVGSSDFKSSEGFTGIFNILKDAYHGDIVIRHWIDEKGVEIASGKNVACVITEDPRGNAITIAEEHRFPLIVVNKIEEANAYALKWTINKFAPNSKKIIISGTNGKSTTSHMIFHILKSMGANAFTNTDSKSEFNTLIDPMIPKLISEEVIFNNNVDDKLDNIYNFDNNQKFNYKLDYLVIEASEVQGWLGKLMKDHAFLMTEAVNPDSAVITNIAMDHIGLVNSIEEVFQETSGVARAIKKGTLILNHDDARVLSMDKFIDEDISKFYFSMENFTKNKNIVDINQYNSIDPHNSLNKFSNSPSNEHESSNSSILSNNSTFQNPQRSNQFNISQSLKTSLNSMENSNYHEEVLDKDTKNSNNYIFKNSNYFSNDNVCTNFILQYDAEKEAIIYKNQLILNIKDLPFKSNHFIQNTLAAISACISLDISLDDIIEGIKSYHPLKRRFKKINQNPLIIDDFAHNPEGIKATIDSVAKMVEKNLKIVCAIRGSRGEEINKINAEALSEIVQLLNKENKSKLSVILSSSHDIVDELNVVEDYEEKIFFDILNKKKIDYIHYENLHDALFETYMMSNNNDAILLIGAQGMDPAEHILKTIIKKMKK